MINPRRPVFLVSVVAFLAAAAVARSADAPSDSSPVMLGSTVFDWDKLAVKYTPVGARRDVADQPTATLERFECHITTLNPGLVSHPPHRHAQEEFIILKEGALDVIINGETRRVGPGSLFFFAANDWHNVRNSGETPATYLVFNVATAATRTAPAEGAARTAAPGTLPSSVFDWEEMDARPTRTGARRAIFDAPTVTCANLEGHVTTVNPGQASHPGHRHPDEELIVVKEGLVEATINGVAQSAGPGSIFFFASNDEHALRNAGDTPATYYVFRIVTDRTPD